MLALFLTGLLQKSLWRPLKALVTRRKSPSAHPNRNRATPATRKRASYLQSGSEAQLTTAAVRNLLPSVAIKKEFRGQALLGRAVHRFIDHHIPIFARNF